MRVFVPMMCVLWTGCDAHGELIIVLDEAWSHQTKLVEMVIVQPREDDGASCKELLELPAPYSADESVPGATLIERFVMDPNDIEELPRLGKLSQGVLIAARARDDDCRVKGHACMKLNLTSYEQEVRLVLEAPEDGEVACPRNYRCEESLGLPGECTYGDCRESVECPFPSNPSHSALCRDWICTSDVDGDGDGAGRLDGLGRVDDCEDDNPDVPSDSGEPVCGAARDFDCDGVLDTLEGCEVPDCQTFELVDVMRPPPEIGSLNGRPAYGVFASGDREAGYRVVVATTTENPESIVLWLGTMDIGGVLTESGSIVIPDTVSKYPYHLAVFGDRAFIIRGEYFDIIDLSDPTLPEGAYRGKVDIRSIDAFTNRRPVISPPFMIVGMLEDTHIWDISFAEPMYGSPVYLGVIGGTDGVRDIAVRDGWIYGLGAASTSFNCLMPSWSSARPYSFEFQECLQLRYLAGFDAEGGRMDAVTTTAEGLVFVAASELHPEPQADEEEFRRRLLFRLRRNGESLDADFISADGTDQALALGRVDEVERTRDLTAWGDQERGVLVRTTGERNEPGEAGLVYFHSIRDPERWTAFDAGGVVNEVAVAGDRVLLAGAATGLLIGRLRCVE